MNTLLYGGRVIGYTVEYADRRTLAITVHPDMTVEVRAPRDAEEEVIHTVLRRRVAWIARQLRFFEQFQPRTPPRQYVPGESHLYLGRQYRLRIRQDERERVQLSGGYLIVTLPDPTDREEVRRRVIRWYGARARRCYKQRLAACLRSPAAYGLTPPRLQARKLAKRWGSLSPAGTLTLNVDLVRAPRWCIDYVIMHELCHQLHPNHSRAFYDRLESVMPDWRERKMALERLLA